MGDPQYFEIDQDEFLRLFPLRASKLMWFLGAGASAASGIKTAWHMILDFKRRLYCSQQKIPLSACRDLSNPVVQVRIDSYLKSKGYAHGDGDDYSYYFEAAYPDEADRQRYISQLVKTGTPSFGHKMLACLTKLQKAPIIWTTNFDTMVEDAVAHVHKETSALTVANLDVADHVHQWLTDMHWPLLVKLHGDFRSKRLKNTREELRKQDTQLQSALAKACSLYGLAVVGYSGRDTSVMQSLEDAIDANAFPAGLFWLKRSDAPLLPAVERLLRKACDAKIDAHVVTVESFDELMGDLIGAIDDVPPWADDIIAERPRRLTEAPIPVSKGTFPVLRFNAFPVIQHPTVCRLIECTIGGAKEVREVVQKCTHPVLAARRAVGVIAFGEDAVLRNAFEPFGIERFDLHTVEFGRLRYESMEHGLLTDALALAIARERPVSLERLGRGRWLVIDPTKANDPAYSGLTVLPSLQGTIRPHQIKWREAVRLRLVGLDNDLWAVIEPTVWFDRPSNDENESFKLLPELREFQRDKAARRYNNLWNAVFDGWATLLFGQANSIRLRALGVTAGIDAEFEVGRTTAFSRRGQVT